jgi:hypothetical protein
MRMRRLLAVAVAGASLGVAGAPAHAATPLFADTWKVKLKSDTIKGNAGRRTSYYSFDRPRFFNFTAHRVRGIGAGIAAPEGPAIVSWDSPDPCDPTLIEHSADQDAGVFYDWDGTYSYLWTFSDGGTSTEPNPRHRNPGPGNHTATF